MLGSVTFPDACHLAPRVTSRGTAVVTGGDDEQVAATGKAPASVPHDANTSASSVSKAKTRHTPLDTLRDASLHSTLLRVPVVSNALNEGLLQRDATPLLKAMQYSLPCKAHSEYMCEITRVFVCVCVCLCVCVCVCVHVYLPSCGLQEEKSTLMASRLDISCYPIAP